MISNSSNSKLSLVDSILDKARISFTNIVNLSVSEIIVFISSSCFSLLFLCKSLAISAVALIMVRGVFKS